MNQAERISQTVEPTIAALGYALVRVQISGQHKPHLQIMVERTDGCPLTVDNCAEVSRSISAVLEVDDPISSAYDLEVSSPGIDRPLVKLADFDRFSGFMAKVDLHETIDGRRRYTGRLLGNDGTVVRLQGDDTEMRVPFEAISRAKLVIDDALLSAAKSADEAGRRSKAE